MTARELELVVDELQVDADSLAFRFEGVCAYESLVRLRRSLVELPTIAASLGGGDHRADSARARRAPHNSGKNRW